MVCEPDSPNLDTIRKYAIQLFEQSEKERVIAFRNGEAYHVHGLTHLKAFAMSVDAASRELYRVTGKWSEPVPYAIAETRADYGAQLQKRVLGEWIKGMFIGPGDHNELGTIVLDGNWNSGFKKRFRGQSNSVLHLAAGLSLGLIHTRGVGFLDSRDRRELADVTVNSEAVLLATQTTNADTRTLGRRILERFHA